MNKKPLNIIILAAGKGKRMQSRLPKVLHTVANKAMLAHVISTAQHLNPEKIIVVHGHQGELVKDYLRDVAVTWVEQVEQLGTGHAVAQALPYLDQGAQVLILAGDVPLITKSTLQQLVTQTAINQLGILTATLNNPTGLGRVIRNAADQVVAIIEERDATPQQRLIQEVYTGTMCVTQTQLTNKLPQLSNQNAQHEYYLTELIALVVEEAVTTVQAVMTTDNAEILGVNDCKQLAEVERIYQQRQVERLMLQGVHFLDPARFDLRGELQVANDVTIDINVIIEGNVSIGENSIIGPNVILRNSQLGKNVQISANSILDGASVGDHCHVGPFARLRPGAQLANNVHVGNFVEIKNTHLGEYSKANHLAYLGDADIGKSVNIGAGTITCNFDGVNKHQTTIGDDVFVGSNSALVAPVVIENNATIGAGSVITKIAPANQLTLTRAAQITLKKWKRPQKKSKPTGSNAS